MPHPISGPITPEELQRIAELPYGLAQDELRKHDPSWGLEDGDAPLRKWRVRFSQEVTMEGWVTVEATTEAAAEAIAANMPDGDISWSHGSSSSACIEEVEPQ